MGGGVGGDASGGLRLRMATQTLPKSLDFVRQAVLRSFKPRVSQWICPWKSGQVGEEGGVVVGGGGGRGGRGGRGLAITCQRRCLVAEGEVGTGMPAVDPEARGPRVWTNSALTLEGGAVPCLDGWSGTKEAEMLDHGVEEPLQAGKS